jgi:gamma-glutamyltranspeptidase/glutathione hydrolase
MSANTMGDSHGKKSLNLPSILSTSKRSSLGGRVSLEAERFSDELVTLFHERGYRIDKREPYSFYLGAIHAVLKKHDGTGFQGVAEVRRDGTAGGY